MSSSAEGSSSTQLTLLPSFLEAAKLCVHQRALENYVYVKKSQTLTVEYLFIVIFISLSFPQSINIYDEIAFNL